MKDNLFLKTTTILPVLNIHETIDWYHRVLDFEARYVHGNGRRGEDGQLANYAIMSRDSVEVHLIADEGGPAWTRAGVGHLGLTVSDVDHLYTDVLGRDVAITRELQQENWPARGFDLTDPSGNVVHIEQPT